MHPSSMERMMNFFQVYVLSKYNLSDYVTIFDIGSRKAHRRHASYKDGLTSRGYLSGNWKYIGIDILEGVNVDIVSQNPYRFLNAGNLADVVISGQTIEHVENPFKWIMEIHRILRPSGLVCIIGPSSGPRHWDRDYWRILPDGMKTLFNHAGLDILDIFLGTNKPWADCVGIAKKRA